MTAKALLADPPWREKIQEDSKLDGGDLPRRTRSRSSLSEKGLEEEGSQEDFDEAFKESEEEDLEEDLEEDFGEDLEEDLEEEILDRGSREEVIELPSVPSDSQEMCEEQSGIALSQDTGQTGHMSPSLVQWGGFALPAICQCQV